ncbi:hypothetical protein [Sutcliffiella rhizosphaerae]|uniref:Uncharacterized protein n=1 Tax=Sutcliffiella rhizosphaerae TaxID=2880967 RepID=A0ABM8YKE6_9BACI|nr:hypothetical protein [Sutcliffiella rhizosphaerae]CAG9620269.1 hypothetical protein BACCIP111883_01037 [Sutcliffiella rhizosphaerae]
MKRIFIAFAAIAIFFMTSVVPFVHTADAWSPKPWTPKPWELKKWEPEPPTEMREWNPSSTDLQKWELRQWVLTQHQMVAWELNNNPDLTPWEVRNYELIAWELEQWDLELQGQGGGPTGGLEGNTSANSPPAQGPMPIPDQDQPSINNPSQNNGNDQYAGNSPSSVETAAPGTGSDSGSSTGPSTYDAIKFISKDIVGSTVNFADKMVRADDADALRNFTDFQKGMFLSGVKTFTKGNDFFDSAFMVKDVVDSSKKAYDAISDYSTLRNIRDLSRAGRIDDALQMAGSVKSFSATNAIVSTALLPFSVADTWNNAQSIQGTSGWDRADAIMNTIGSAGGVISGLAAPVAMIPGGQVVAAGLLAVGTVLSLGSVVYKAARNWRKIKDTAVNTVKNIGNGIKNVGSKIASWFK